MRLDPIQAALIPAHVTLCREDEIDHLDPDTLYRQIQTWQHGPLQLAFGPPQRFNGHGLLLPCTQGSAPFQGLRQWLLRNPQAREHHAHLTLAHPRNPQAPGNTDTTLATCPPALQLEFATVALIQQHGAAPWVVLWEEELGGRAGVG